MDGAVSTVVGKEPRVADSLDAAVRFHNAPFYRDMVADGDSAIEVVEIPLAPPLWMSLVEEAALAPDEAKMAALAALEDYGKLLEDSELADVVLLVEGHRFPAHRAILAARSDYFRGLFKSGLQEASRVSLGQHEFELWEISAAAFRVLLRYLYTAQVPERKETALYIIQKSGAGGNGGKGDQRGGVDKGMAGGGCKGKGAEGEEASRRQTMEREVLMVADLFQADGLLNHCLKVFRQSLTLYTAVEHLVWAHLHGPQEARTLATAYVVLNFKAIQVCVTVYGTLPVSVRVFFCVLVCVFVCVVSVTVCLCLSTNGSSTESCTYIKHTFSAPVLVPDVYIYLQREVKETLGSIIIICEMKFLFRLNMLISTCTHALTYTYVNSFT